MKKNKDGKPDFFPNAPDGTEDALLELLRTCELEDENIRTSQLAIWKRNENYFEHIQNIYWNENLGDWSTMGSNGLSTGGQNGGEETRDDSGPLYDYVINVFRAHGESIIAALSQSVLTGEFFPDDAEEVDDISIAKAKTRLSLIIQKHNKAKLCLMEILFKFFNQGLCCIYRHRDRNEKYGTVKVPKYEKVEQKSTFFVCPECGKNVYEASDGEVLVSLPRCEKCQKDTKPEEKTDKKMQKVGEQDFPKAKETWDIYGPLNVKVPYYARNQAECGYVIFYFDENVAKAWNDNPDFREDIEADASAGKERWSRTPVSYITNWMGTTEDTNLTTVKRVWFKPWQFELIAGNKADDSKMDIVRYLKDKFNNGLHMEVISKKIVDVYPENDAKSWIIRKSSVSGYIHSSPVGQGIVPIQEMTNQLANLTIESIEYGVPATIADTEYLDFDTFGQQSTSPGMITPGKAPPGHNLNDGFFQLNTATPSKEIEVFRDRLDADAEFVVGDPPSIYGGQAEGNTRTLGEYQQSGRQAMARLSIVFEHLRELWGDLNILSVNEHIDEMKTFHYDEQMTQRDGKGFKTQKAKSTDFESGGASYFEVGDFPISSEQKKALILQLMQVPEVLPYLAHPENASVVSAALGLPELYIPGEAQRFKAFVAIKYLLRAAPTEMPQMGPDGMPTGQMQDIPTITPDEDADDPALQSEIIKIWMADERGMEARIQNPAGYANVKAYNKALQQLLVQKTMMQNATPSGVPPNSDIAQ